MSDWEDNDGPVSTKPQTGFGGGDSGFGFGNMKISEDNNNNFDGFGSSDNRQGGRGRGRGRGRDSGRGRGSACFKCNQEGHRASDCPNGDSEGGDGFGSFGGGSRRDDGFGDRPKRGRGCFKCHQEGHRANECPNGESEGGDAFGSFGGDNKRDGGFGDRPKRGRGCFKCQQEGHRAAECPNSESSGGDGFGGDSQRKKGCFKCGEEGHMSRDCPSNTGGSSSTPGEGGEGEEFKPRNPLYIPKDMEDEELASQGIEVGINFDNYGNIPIKVSGDGTIPAEVKDFKLMNVRKLLEDNITKANYTKPTPIQSSAVPILMAGRDLMGCAQTGSGKTVAYLLPILNHILKESCSSHAHEESAKPTALIVCPTRELALQIYYESRKLGLGSTALSRVAYGGTAVYHQLQQIQQGCHVLVGTVGRVIDFMEKGKICFNDLKFLVLDEADRMLSMGFLGDLKKIFEHSSMPPTDQRQTLMFSATFPSEIQTLALSFMNNYVFVVVGIVGAANADVTQELLQVDRAQKKDLLVEHIKEMRKVEETVKILVFVERKKMADFVGAYLCNNDITATTIHGDRLQQQREEALETFRAGKFNVLVATAVAARGLDIRGVGCVINFDLPKEVDEYVHRIGRTGRVGNSGYALSFYDVEADAHLSKDLLKILSEANQEVPEWLKTAADGSGHAQGYFGSGNYASVDVRKNVSSRDDGRNWGGDALGGPAASAPVAADDDDWDA